jgi:acetyl esterase/lipase
MTGGRRAAALATALLAVALGRGSPAGADVLVLESGKTATGVAIPAGQEVRLNTFGCSVPEMTLGVKVYRARDVKRVDPDEDPPWICARVEDLLDAPPPDLEAQLRSLHGLAKRKGYKDWARRLAEEVLARGEDAECLKYVGGPVKWAERRRGDPRLDPVLAESVGRLLTLERGAARRDAAARLTASHGLAARPETLERMARSLAEPVGLLEEVPLAWRGAETPAGTYSLYVPPDAHPTEARPLVVALHGGGVIEREGAVPMLGGTGKDMLRLLLDGAERLGWFLLCPTAVEAPWDSPANRAFLEAVLTEVGGRWNVDLARVHLIGLGEGGEGAWSYGLLWDDRWAAVGASSAGVPSGASTLVSSHVGVWIQHGEDDRVRPVEPVRRAAERLQDAGADFVYCELPKQGHGLPSSAERDWYRYVAGRRNPRAKDAWPQPSFERPVSDLERGALGDPAGAWGLTLKGDAPPDALWKALARGQAEADPAADRLLAARPEGAVARASAIVDDLKAPATARGWAAWLLGELGDPSALQALGDALRASDDPLLSVRLTRALRRLDLPETKETLRFALLDATGRHQRATFPGGRVPFTAYERIAGLTAELVEALALVGTADDVGPDIEQAAVTGLLKDARPVDARRGPGGDPAVPRLALIRSVGRAYRTLKVEATLLDMLRAVLKKDARALQAMGEGLTEGVRR